MNMRIILFITVILQSMSSNIFGMDIAKYYASKFANLFNIYAGKSQPHRQHRSI